jgi:hypothetical protein
MANAEDAASAAGRALAEKRWGPSQVVSRSVQVVVDRADELTGEQLEQLAAVLERKDGADGD